MSKTCQTCDHAPSNVEDKPACANCVSIVYNNWKQKESPTWKIYVEQKVNEQMQNLYKAFEYVPDDCQQARFIKGLDAPKSCRLCGLGPCPNGISIKGMKL